MASSTAAKMLRAISAYQPAPASPMAARIDGSTPSVWTPSALRAAGRRRRTSSTTVQTASGPGGTSFDRRFDRVVALAGLVWLKVLLGSIRLDLTGDLGANRGHKPPLLTGTCNRFRACRTDGIRVEGDGSS